MALPSSTLGIHSGNAKPRAWSRARIAVSLADGKSPPVVKEIDAPYARVGRLNDAEIVLPTFVGASLSYYLHAVDEKVYCLNLEPPRWGRSGLNGWLDEATDAHVRQWSVNAWVLSPAQPLTPLQPDLRATGSAGAGTPELLIESNDGHRRAAYRLRRRLTLIGRQNPSKLRLDHSSISDAHCVLYWDGSALWAIDLLSERGTLLNGNRIDCAQVQRGDVLEIGKYRVAWPEDAAPLAPRLTGWSPTAAVDHAVEIEQLDQELAAAKLAAKIAAGERDQIGAKSQALAEELELAIERAADATRERSAERGALLENRASLEASLLQANQEIENLRRQAQSLLADSQASVDRAAQTASRLAALEEESLSLRQQLDQRGREVEQAREGLEARRAHVEAQQSSLEEQQQARARAEKARDAIASRLAELQGEFQAACDSLAAATAARQADAARQRDLEMQLAAKAAAESDAEIQLADLDRRHRAALADIASTRDRSMESQAELAAVRADLAVVQAELAAARERAESDLRDSREQLAESTRRMAALEVSTVQERQRREAAERQVDALQTEQAALQSTLGARQAALASLQASQADLRAGCDATRADLRASLEAAAAERISWESREAESRAQVERTLAALAEARRQSARSEIELARHRAEADERGCLADALQQQSTLANEQLEAWRNRHESSIAAWQAEREAWRQRLAAAERQVVTTAAYADSPPIQEPPDSRVAPPDVSVSASEGANSSFAPRDDFTPRTVIEHNGNDDDRDPFDHLLNLHADKNSGQRHWLLRAVLLGATAIAVSVAAYFFWRHFKGK